MPLSFSLAAAGVVLASLGKVVSAVKGGPQKMQAMAMEQMMKQMMKQMGNAQGGFPSLFLVTERCLLLVLCLLWGTIA